MKRPKNSIGILSEDLELMTEKRPAEVEKYIVSLIKKSNVEEVRQLSEDLLKGLIDKTYWSYRIAELLGLIPEYKN